MIDHQVHRFAGYTLDVAAMRLLRDGKELPLEPKTFRLLVLLVEHRDEVLTKAEIFDSVWEATAVSDNALTRAIAQIRRALNDDPRAPDFIKTVPTVGYQFIGNLEPVAGTAGSTLPTVLPKLPVERIAPRPRMRWVVPVVAGFVLLSVAGVLVRWRFRQVRAQPQLNLSVPLTSSRGSQDAPSFSPDGTMVAYEWNGEAGDNTDIYVKSLSPDAVPLRLTSGPEQETRPSWSPNGRMIAFQRVKTPESVELMLIPALGGLERRLAEYRVRLTECGFLLGLT